MLTRRRPQAPAGSDVPHVLTVASGFAGLHCARELERLLRPGEARVTLSSPTDYMLYSPPLPQVATSILSPSDVAVGQAEYREGVGLREVVDGALGESEVQVSHLSADDARSAATALPAAP